MKNNEIINIVIMTLIATLIFSAGWYVGSDIKSRECTLTQQLKTFGCPDTIIDHDKVNLSSILMAGNIDKFCQLKGYEYGYVSTYHSLPSGIVCYYFNSDFTNIKTFSFDDIYEVL